LKITKTNSKTEVTREPVWMKWTEATNRWKPKSASPAKRTRSETTNAEELPGGPKTTSQLGLEEAEMVDDLALASLFPSVFGGPDNEVTYSSNPLWHELSVYPGWRQVERVKNKWLEEERRRSGPSNQPTWEGDEFIERESQHWDSADEIDKQLIDN
jgi:hypothetical protein